MELYNTDGSQGAARGAGMGLGYYKNREEAFVGLTATHTIEPDAARAEQYQQAYGRWKEALKE